MRSDPAESLSMEHFPYPSRRMPVLASRGVVATSQPLAAQAGLWMLQQGGNAVDAALATAIALTVVEPTSNGIGADAFALVWDGDEAARAERLRPRPGRATRRSCSRGSATPTMPSARLAAGDGAGRARAPGATCTRASAGCRSPTLFEPAIGYAERRLPGRADRSAQRLGAAPRASTPRRCTGRSSRAGRRPSRRDGTRAAPPARCWTSCRTTRAPCAASPRAAPTTSTRASWRRRSPTSPPRPAAT